jgi:peroxiredoxin
MVMLIKISLYVLIAVVAGVLGISLGGVYTKSRQSAAEAERLKAREQYLLSNIRGIEAGKSFPDIPLWKPDGVAAVQIRDLLPLGGLVIYTSGDCPACIETVRALGEAIRSTGDHVSPAVIVVQGDPARIIEFVSKESINVALVRDSQQTLFNDYGVVTFPMYFLLDKGQIIRSFGQAQGTGDEFTGLLTQWQHLSEGK